MPTLSRTIAALFLSLALTPDAQAYSYLQEGVRGWVEGQVTIDYDLSRCDRPESELLSALDRSIALWNSVPTAKVRARRGIKVQGVNPASLMVRITPGNAIFACSTSFKSDTGRDPTYTLAVGGAAVDDGGRIGFGYAILNSDPSGGVTAADIGDDELVAVIAHEIGHSLGLGHSDHDDALMHPQAAALPSLAQDDVDGITSLYARPPSADEQGGVFGCASVAAVGGAGKGPRGGSGGGSFGMRDLKGASELLFLALVSYLFLMATRRRARELALTPVTA